jgi:hypothetical protein
MKISVKQERHNYIKSLDITIRRKNAKLEFEIYRRPTETEIVTPKESHHPLENKYVIKYILTNRANTKIIAIIRNIIKTINKAIKY